MLSEEQMGQLKAQIIRQIDSSFPEDKKDAAKAQISSMSLEELEEFLEKNKMAQQNTSKCIFCSIVSGDIPSYKIKENKSAIAVLEINPVSMGHVLIIPKKHSSSKKFPKEIVNLAKKISQKIKILSPKKIDVVPSNLFGHEILNVIPVYSNETLDSERSKAEKEELEQIAAKLAKKQKTLEKAPKAKKIAEKLWLPRRLP